MKKTFLVLALSAYFMLPAQEHKNRLSGGFGHFAGSFETVQVTGLNTSLKGAGYGEVPGSMLSFGGGGAFVVSNFIVSMGGASFSGYSASNDSTTVEMSGGYGFLSGGYVISTGPRSFLYPTIGVGFGGLGFYLGKKGATNDFEQQLELPRGRVQTGAGGTFLNAQLSWQRMIGTSGKQGWSLGIRAGYRWSPRGQWDMHLNGEKAVRGPQVNLDGYHVTLIIGGGALATQ